MEGRLREEKNFKPEGKVKRFFKKLAYSTVLPVAMATGLAVSPVAKHINPFHSKPALAEEASTTDKDAEKKDEKKDANEKKEAEKVSEDIEEPQKQEFFYEGIPITPAEPMDKKVKSKTGIRLGGKVIANEAGSSISGIGEYKDLGGVNFGAIMFGEVVAPYVNLKLTPGIVKKGFKVRYYGNLTFTQLNSWLYTSHSLGVGYSHQDEQFGISTGIIGGGALSYPKFDDIYFNLMCGAAINIKQMVYFYTVAKSYFAAGNAMQSAYALYYGPHFQGIEVGGVLKIKEMYANVFADFDAVQNKYGMKLGTIIDFTDNVKGHVWVGAGATQWREGLGGGASFMAMAGIKLFIIGRYVNTDYTVSYEHYGKGGIPLDIDINSPPNLRPPTPEEASWEESARANLLESSSMEEFASKYCCGHSEDEVITVARWLGRSLGEVAYANSAEQAMMQWNFFDTSIKNIADATHDDILWFLKQYNQWYQDHGTYDGMPQYLIDGIAVCAGIHSTVAEFLRMNGINALAISVNSPVEPHVITLAFTDKKTMLFDYGDLYVAGGDKIDQLIRAYGQYNKSPTYNAQIFTEDYVGTWVTPEGRLLHKTIGVENADELKGFFLEIPGY